MFCCAAGENNRLHRCHPHCRPRRLSSLSTLAGDELTEFLDLANMDVEIDCEAVGDSSAVTECLADSDDGYTL